MFWTKCGKLILIDCDTCPCPYWGVFVFVVKPYNQSTGAIDYCSASASTQIKNVLDNCITFNGASIRITTQSEGLVGSFHGCRNNSCMDILVYKVSPCFQTYAECYEFYNSFEEGYWDEIESKYLGNVSATVNIYRYYDSFFGPFVEECESTWECFDMQTGDEVYSGPTYPDIPPGADWDCYEFYGECTTYCITTGSGVKIGQLNYDLHPDLQVYMGESIAELNTLVSGQLGSPQNWPLYSSNQNNSRCFNFSYGSGYNYWGEDSGCASSRRMWAERASIQLQSFNSSKHPAGATGAKFKMVVTKTFVNDDCSETTSATSTELSLQFGSTFNFADIAGNLDPFYQVECWEEFVGFKSQLCSGQNISVQVQFMEYTF